MDKISNALHQSSWYERVLLYCYPIWKGNNIKLFTHVKKINERKLHKNENGRRIILSFLSLLRNTFTFGPSCNCNIEYIVMEHCKRMATQRALYHTHHALAFPTLTDSPKFIPSPFRLLPFLFVQKRISPNLILSPSPLLHIVYVQRRISQNLIPPVSHLFHCVFVQKHMLPKFILSSYTIFRFVQTCIFDRPPVVVHLCEDKMKFWSVGSGRALRVGQWAWPFLVRNFTLSHACGAAFGGKWSSFGTSRV